MFINIFEKSLFDNLEISKLFAIDLTNSRQKRNWLSQRAINFKKKIYHRWKRGFQLLHCQRNWLLFYWRWPAEERRIKRFIGRKLQQNWKERRHKTFRFYLPVALACSGISWKVVSKTFSCGDAGEEKSSKCCLEMRARGGRGFASSGALRGRL